MATEAPLAASSLVKGGPAMRLFGSWGVYAVNVMLLYTIDGCPLTGCDLIVFTSDHNVDRLGEMFERGDFLFTGHRGFGCNGICGDEEGMALAVASVV